MKARCEMCKSDATVKITYGLYEMYEKGRLHHVLRLCNEHNKELYERLKNAVKAGLMHYVLSKV